MSAALYPSCKREERSFRVRGVVQHTDAERIIERLFERQLEDIALYDVSVRQAACECECRLDAVSEIDADDIRGSPLGGELSVPAFAAATLDDGLAFEKVASYGLQPAE